MQTTRISKSNQNTPVGQCADVAEPLMTSGGLINTEFTSYQSAVCLVTLRINATLRPILPIRIPQDNKPAICKPNRL